MDLSIIRRRTRVDLDGDHLVVIHRPAAVGHVDAWRQHLGASPLPCSDQVAAAWLRDGHDIGSRILRDVVIGWADLTADGHDLDRDQGIAAVLADWNLTRRVVAQVIASAELDAAVGKGCGPASSTS